jgi:hypothetical protein
MGKFGKELIESMQQAARHAAGKRVQAKEIKQRHRTFATAELSDKRVKAMAPHAWTRGMRVSTPSLSRSSKRGQFCAIGQVASCFGKSKSAPVKS